MILRSLVDNYLYHERRSKFWRGAWGVAAKVLASLGVLAVIAASVKNLIGG